jgi:hypothetical protein
MLGHCVPKYLKVILHLAHGLGLNLTSCMKASTPRALVSLPSQRLGLSIQKDLKFIMHLAQDFGINPIRSMKARKTP